MQIDDEDDLKAELETGRLEADGPGTRQWELEAWHLFAKVKCAHAKYDQQQAAQFALYRAMQKQNLN